MAREHIAAVGPGGSRLREDGTRAVSDRRLQEARAGTRSAASGLPTKNVRCAGMKTDGSGRCNARPAKGTKLCIGHLRSEGS